MLTVNIKFNKEGQRRTSFNGSIRCMGCDSGANIISLDHRGDTPLNSEFDIWGNVMRIEVKKGSGEFKVNFPTSEE